MMIAPIGTPIVPQPGPLAPSESDPPPAQNQQVAEPEQSGDSSSTSGQSNQDPSQSGTNGSVSNSVVAARNADSLAVVAEVALAAAGMETRLTSDGQASADSEEILRAEAEAVQQATRGQLVMADIAQAFHSDEADEGGVPNLVIDVPETQTALNGFAEANSMSSPVDQPSVDTRS